MKFFPYATDFIYDGQCILQDNNIAFTPSHDSDGTIQFGSWNQELNILMDTRKIVSFEAIFSYKEVKPAKLRLPECINASIVVDSIQKRSKSLKIYYDSEIEWFCFGNKEYSGKGYCFATNTIAIINDDNILEAIFVKPYQIK